MRRCPAPCGRHRRVASIAPRPLALPRHNKGFPSVVPPLPGRGCVIVETLSTGLAPVGGIPELRKSIALGPLAKGRCLCHHITKEQPSSCGHWGGVVRAELLLLSVHAGSFLGAVVHPGAARLPMSSAAYQSCVGMACLRESCCCVVAAELVPRGLMCWCTLGRFATGARHRWTVSKSCKALLLVRW